ncbi:MULTISPECIES: YaiI/YqxD family protein [unclassified Staphylococcus]|uniref:YaiI/YqxD family protein n=1 Tax=unclassified Staphylococcus TaxID=91994 RepID=UPI0021D1EED0|nr:MULTISPECIES: YaiI/YqxD family protein [unclassified Staphylococcus]UXR69935.1 YaiI/YqxD family protein [Staphylococcus sp. IVB6246]UXR71974.1 YaiI/YqxD family protein [Staphylococcus sp. IVB6240]UXR74282.1 YaiI/YqxD family protein [Staphylococcus sp. IVB6238]UXR76669.1 YaiI/YqxD family protein [Staphylococcus sp. IVB6233]UXR80798.1 YaiI/YqxD family protein [Staphylococcus sp. IVB6218]
MQITGILVDGDACPVIDTIIHVSQNAGVSVFIFRSYDHFSHQVYPDHVHIKYMDGGRDAVDFSLLRDVKESNIVVTQDYGLASLALNKTPYVLHHTGQHYTPDNIEQLLAQRYHHQQLRRTTKRHNKGPKPFTEVQQQNFKQALIEILNQSKH